MSYFYPLSKVAVGYNNTGGLVAWESLADANGIHFFAPVVFGGWDPGSFSTLTDGTLYMAGWQSSDIQWPAITQAQVYYLINTICAGSYSGPVTIEFRKENPASYVTANAILTLPKLIDSRKQSQAYTNYKARLTRIATI